MNKNMKKVEIDYRDLTEKALAAYSQIDDVMVNWMTGQDGAYYIWNGMDDYVRIGAIGDVNVYLENMYDAYGLDDDED